MAKKVIFVSKPKLVSLFKRNFPNCQIVSQNDGIPAYNYHVALLDLPKCFNTTIDSIPYPISFLSVDEGLKAQWKKILGPKTKLRIGILLSSNSIAYITKFRSVKVESMIDIFDSNFEFVNLSIDSSDEDKKIFDTYGVKTYTDAMGDFYTTAGLVVNLDLVITVDTYMAHLAGSLGIPTLVLLHKYGSDWRWFLDRIDSPFYSCVKLIRQSERNKFDDMVLSIQKELENLS